MEEDVEGEEGDGDAKAPALDLVGGPGAWERVDHWTVRC